VASGLPKDGLPALVHPPLMSVSEVDSLNKAERGKYLVPTDRIIGFVRNGVARAYPLRVLNWHEVVNDTVAGQPVAITFNPLCESSVVFQRIVATDTLELRVSGLLYNSNLLMYDHRQHGEDESLWSQLQGRAIAGPAAAKELTLPVLPCVVVSWHAWRTWFPESMVLFPTQQFRERYKRNPYGVYHGSDKLRFPVRPLPTAPPSGREALHYKERIVAVHTGDNWQIYPLAELVKRCGEGGEWLTYQDGVSLRFLCGDKPATAAVFLGDSRELAPTIYAFWFAWYAHRSVVSANSSRTD